MGTDAKSYRLTLLLKGEESNIIRALKHALKMVWRTYRVKCRSARLDEVA